MIAGVVFDMDGILIDSEPLFRLAARQAASDLGYTLHDADYERWMGLPPAGVEAGVRETMGRDFPMESFRDEFRRIWTAHTDQHGVAAQPGMAELLAELNDRAIPFGVATSTERSAAERSLELAGLRSHIRHMVTGDEVERGKPDPSIFLVAAAQIGVAPRACVALEDSAAGVKAAAGATMLTIMVPDLHQPDDKLAALARFVLPDTRRAAQVVLRLFESGN